ncbi:MAG: NADH-quinone oxidoreductase subunit J [Tepidisphaeraceae bacterium]
MITLLAQADPDMHATATAVLFYLFAAMTGGSALVVVISRNIVRTAVALLFTLAGVAGLYFLLNAEFLAAVQLVVYAGGTLILIIFGVMLTSKSPYSRFEAKLGEVILALSIGVILFFALTLAITKTVFGDEPIVTGSYPVDRLGQILLGDYLVPFEIVSVLLLAVMIGAAYLAKGRRREGEEANNPPVMSKRAREWS